MKFKMCIHVQIFDIVYGIKSINYSTVNVNYKKSADLNKNKTMHLLDRLPDVKHIKLVK